MGKRKSQYYSKKRVGWFKKKQMIHRKKIFEDQDLMTCDVGASVNNNDLINNFAVSDEKVEEDMVEQELALTLEENRNNETGKSTNDSDHELTIETEVLEEKELIIEGNRIVDFAYIYEQLLEISQHNSPLGCNLNCLKLTKEIKKGFLSIFRFTCKMCNSQFKIHNCKKPDNEDELNLNENVVSCFMSIGSAFTGLEQVSSSLNIPCMSNKLYAKCHTKVCELWELAKEKTMTEAGKEEYNLAILNGDVDANGVPKIVVVADACWSKRSYRKNYNALSGAAVIIGYRTKKVLYMAVKNKYCMVCARSENKKQEIPDHICFKNYKGSSSGMESTALVEGFKSSMDTHGLIYAKLIADGDSSTHKKIEMAKPYGNLLVEKIECTNHLLRNYRTKLDELTKNTCYPLQYRKAVQKNLKRFSNAVTGAVDYISKKDTNFAEKVIELKQDLLNGPHHILGDHSSCKEYFCDRISNEAPTEENLVPAMKSQEGRFIFTALIKYVSRLVNNAKSLMHNVNSNIAEVFNSVIAKFIGGKRINYSCRQSYSGRCAASVVSFNTKGFQTYLHKKMFHRSPNKLVKRLESEKKNRLMRAKRRIFKSNFNEATNYTSDKNYGEACEKPDLPLDDFNFAKQEHMKNISLSDEERHALERRTLLQAESIEWRQERKSRLTASVFGKICKRGLIKCGPLIKNLVTEKSLDHVKSIQHGQSHEHIARDELSKKLNKSIERCGLFIDKLLPFLGASPDGLIDDDKIVEIKCPYSAKGMSIDDAITEKKIIFWKKDKDGNTTINKRHDWYYQAQGQLHVTGRKLCIFVVWTDLEMKIEMIEEDTLFWKDMEEKLTRFYFNCLLPELVDSRLDRQMEIKEPDYILEALEEKEKANKRKIDEKEEKAKANVKKTQEKEEKVKSNKRRIEEKDKARKRQPDEKFKKTNKRQIKKKMVKESSNKHTVHENGVNENINKKKLEEKDEAEDGKTRQFEEREKNINANRPIIEETQEKEKADKGKIQETKEKANKCRIKEKEKKCERKIEEIQEIEEENTKRPTDEKKVKENSTKCNIDKNEVKEKTNKRKLERKEEENAKKRQIEEKKGKKDNK